MKSRGLQAVRSTDRRNAAAGLWRGIESGLPFGGSHKGERGRKARNI